MTKNIFYAVTVLFLLLSLSIDTQAQKRDSLLQKPMRMYYMKQKGYMGSVEAGLMVGFEPAYINSYYYGGVQRRENITISLRTVHGYRVFPYLFAGGGVGFDRYTGQFQSYVPLFVRVQSDFLKRRVTPIAYIDAGYSFLVQEHKQEGIIFRDKDGGAYVATGVGVRIYTPSRASVTFTLGYAMHKSHSRYVYEYAQDIYYDIYRTYQRMTIGVGVGF